MSNYTALNGRDPTQNQDKVMPNTMKGPNIVKPSITINENYGNLIERQQFNDPKKPRFAMPAQSRPGEIGKGNRQGLWS